MTGVGRILGAVEDLDFEEEEEDLGFDRGLATLVVGDLSTVVLGRRVVTRVVLGGLVVVVGRRVRVVEGGRREEVLFRLREVVEEALEREVVRGSKVVGLVELRELVEFPEGRTEVVRTLVELEEVRRTAVVEESEVLFLPFPPGFATPRPVEFPTTAVAVTTVPFFLARNCPPSCAPTPWVVLVDSAVLFKSSRAVELRVGKVDRLEELDEAARAREERRGRRRRTSLGRRCCRLSGTIKRGWLTCSFYCDAEADPDGPVVGRSKECELSLGREAAQGLKKGTEEGPCVRLGLLLGLLG